MNLFQFPCIKLHRLFVCLYLLFNLSTGNPLRGPSGSCNGSCNFLEGCAGCFLWLRNSVSIKPLTFENLQSIKTDLHVGFTEVLGAWNFTLQADTPLYWLRCGRLDKCPRGTLTPRVLDMTWDTQKCDFLRLMDKLLQTLRCEYLMILQGLNTGFCP